MDCSFRGMRADRQTDWHADRNTSHSYRGEVTTTTSVQSNWVKGRIVVLSPLSAVNGSWPHLIHGSLAHKSQPQTASRSVQPFLYSSPVWTTHRHTAHAACVIFRNRPDLCPACMRCSPVITIIMIIRCAYNVDDVWTSSNARFLRPSPAFAHVR